MENPIKMDDLGLIILIISVPWFFLKVTNVGKPMPGTYHLGMVTHKRNGDFGDGFNYGKKNGRKRPSMLFNSS